MFRSRRGFSRRRSLRSFRRHLKTRRLNRPILSRGGFRL